MTSYEYRCRTCGPFSIARAMGDALSQTACPECGGVARRVFTPPGLSRTRTALATAISRAEASATEPAVVIR